MADLTDAQMRELALREAAVFGCISTLAEMVAHRGTGRQCPVRMWTAAERHLTELQAIMDAMPAEAKAGAALAREAAPDLLAALKAMVAKHDDRDAISDLWPREAAQARAAIAKATGTKVGG